MAIGTAVNINVASIRFSILLWHHIGNPVQLNIPSPQTVEFALHQRDQPAYRSRDRVTVYPSTTCDRRI